MADGPELLKYLTLAGGEAEVDLSRCRRYRFVDGDPPNGDLWMDWRYTAQWEAYRLLVRTPAGRWVDPSDAMAPFAFDGDLGAEIMASEARDLFVALEWQSYIPGDDVFALRGPEDSFWQYRRGLPRELVDDLDRIEVGVIVHGPAGPVTIGPNEKSLDPKDLEIVVGLVLGGGATRDELEAKYGTNARHRLKALAKDRDWETVITFPNGKKDIKYAIRGRIEDSG